MAVELTDENDTTQEDTSPDYLKTLGMYASFPVSDQQEWTKELLEAEIETLPANIRAMVVAACQRESLGRRLEVEGAWRLQLMDRGFHRLIPNKRGGWNISGQGGGNQLGIYGQMYYGDQHDANVIGAHNDIIANALTRDIPKTEFTPKSDNDKATTAATAANNIKWFIQEDAQYKQKQAEVARIMCTDERGAVLCRPMADAQRFGFEDDSENVVPETEDATPIGGPSKKPRIQTVLEVYGKLEHKTQIAIDDDSQSPYQIIAKERDTAQQRAKYPWITEPIEGGSAGIAEIELDRVARASIKLAIQGGLVTGQGNVNDTTELEAWITPAFYWDSSCSEECREWLLENMPKGFLATYSGTNLAFVRNESWNETGNVFHARTGKGQNRRSLTEAYAGSQMRLDNWLDLIDKFFRATVPRVFLDAKAFNVDQIRQSGNQVGRIEPFNSAMIPQGATAMLEMPMPTHQPTLPDFIQWFAGGLAELLTGAQPTLAGQDGDVEGTLGEAKMDNDSALTRLSEPWAAMCRLFSSATRQAVRWNAKVQPAGKVFDRMIGSQGRLRVEMADLDDEVIAVAETDTNFPESWSEREERVWQMVQSSNPFVSGIMMQPGNATILKDTARMGITIPGAASWEKQEGEFTLLFAGKPMPNPQLAQIQQQIQKIQMSVQQGTMETQQKQAQGMPVDPQETQMLQQGQQLLQQLQQQAQSLPPLVSSVPIRPDTSEEHAIEAQCCLAKMISAEGRRMAHSQPIMGPSGQMPSKDQLAFANLHLHWAEHDAMAKKLAPPAKVDPRISITAALDKAPPAVQAQGWQTLGLEASPDDFAELGPHEIEHEVKGVNAQGAEETIKTSLSGKQLD